jgi:hypothetical protein
VGAVYRLLGGVPKPAAQLTRLTPGKGGKLCERHCLFDIGDEVLGFFQSDVEADQVAAVVAVGAAEGLVGHDEARDAAPAIADFEEAEGLDEFYDSRGRPGALEDD